MILVLVAAWLGFLSLLVRFGILKSWTRWMKLSPLVMFLACQIFLLIPMSFGAPSGRAVVMKNTIQIIPSVSGMVIDVPIESEVELHKGQVLFTIDPAPYQAEVNRLEAALKETQQAAKMLPSDLAAANAAVLQTEAALISANKQAESLKVLVDAADASVAKQKAQAELAKAEFGRAKELAASKAMTEAELEANERNLAAAKAGLEEAKAKRQQAQLALDSQIDGVNTIVIQAEEALQIAQARRVKAKLALESTINGEDADVAQIQAQLELAKIKLSWTSVEAPTTGFVVNVSLQPGAMVLAEKSEVLSFVDESTQVIGAQIDQIHLRHIEVGQPAEVIFKLYPGKVFEAQVDKVIRASPSGQVAPSGFALESFEISPDPFWVRLAIKDKSLSFPPGAVGTVAIYTNHYKVSHIFRQLILRMENWLNYCRAD
ncbi:Inner membrane protein YibH [Symmachiella macrocystis]|uniref:Inner membrane protein YibH n=1 Tax=Symmachiella macrocystis TaxID=2527985 RepID=A0A5C6BMS2_9PLAN|nr:biotin/lipoyl-binding protein [Symmachiella macrocystis]TWU13368.1 Inner membrane protein YibH [Symmachiella macrocystis]